MIKNYFKITFRNLWRNKTASFINVFGLTIGLTSCLLIGIYIQHELNYDKFEQKGDRIARVIMAYKFDGGDEMKKGNFTSVRVAKVFKQTFPEIENAVRMTQTSQVVRYNDKLINEKKFMFADPSFFNIFSFKLLRGDPKTVLDAPDKLVLTQATSKKYFGDENPVGKALKVGTDSTNYQVTGVIQDSPSDSQIKFDFLASFSSLHTEDQEATYWDANYTTYFLLKQPSDVSTLQAKITPFMQKEMKGQGATVDFTLEPFMSIHLHSEFDGFEPSNNIKYVYILEAAALLILVIACFTYISLNTARSIERAREVGVRKVIGARKSQLFWQFIGESAILCSAAVVLSLGLAVILLPEFNQLTERQLTVQSIFSAQFIGGLVLITLLVSLAAGSYPALILSNFQPVKVLKGAFKNTGSGQLVRKALIVFQFSISVLLIVCTVIMQKQLSFIQNKDMGYNRDHVLVLPMDKRMLSNLQTIKTELKSNNNVRCVSACVSTPVEIGGGYNMRSSIMPENQQIAVTADPIDEDFVKTTGLKIVTGADLNQQDMKDVSNKDDKQDVYHFILNEAAAKELGWTAETAIGQRMFLDDSRPGFVKAVVKDFNFQSVHEPIRPLVLFPAIRGRSLLIKLSGNNIQQTISFIGNKWKELVPYRPFEYRFLDEDFNNLYNSELRLGTVLDIFSSVAIVLACLGLFGLSAYSAKQRVKEIGIRKVLGAKVGNIVTTLSGDFVKLVLVSIIISSPLAWWLTDKWLQGFAYRAEVTAWIFIAAGLAVVIIALLTVSIQTIKAAMANPVTSLRNE
jgi:putative ABC transport system permease protein